MAGHELLATRRGRVLEDLLRRSLLFDQALVQEDDFTGHLAGKVHLVRHQQHGTAFFGQCADNVKHFLDHFRIERRGRLVEQDDFGLHGQRAGDGRALLLATGKLGGVAVTLVVDADLVQQRFGGFDGFGLALAKHAARRLDDVVEDRHVRPQVEILEDKADFAAQAVDLAIVGGDQVAILGSLELERLTGDQDFTLVRVLQQVDAAQQRGLAGTGRPQDGDHVTVAGGQRNALENFLIAVAFMQIADFQRGRGLSHVRSSCVRVRSQLLAAFLASATLA
ncbi:6-pyruvoyl-tetrahydropterin synthase [Pseudomonas sp. VLB120]|nr:6-pyruvoyl-tetrahydropterin synthase [Pseudomonas sp. VLB120]